MSKEMFLFYFIFLRGGGLICAFKIERSIPMVAMSVWATTVFSIMKLQDGFCLLCKILPMVKVGIMVLFTGTIYLCHVNIKVNW